MADGVRRIGIGSRFQRGFRVLTFPHSLTQLSKGGGRWMRFSPFPLSHPGWPLRTDFGPFYPTFFSASLAHSLTHSQLRARAVAAWRGDYGLSPFTVIYSFIPFLLRRRSPPSSVDVVYCVHQLSRGWPPRRGGRGRPQLGNDDRPPHRAIKFLPQRTTHRRTQRIQCLRSSFARNHKA